MPPAVATNAIRLIEAVAQSQDGPGAGTVQLPDAALVVRIALSRLVFANAHQHDARLLQWRARCRSIGYRFSRCGDFSSHFVGTNVTLKAGLADANSVGVPIREVCVEGPIAPVPAGSFSYTRDVGARVLNAR